MSRALYWLSRPTAGLHWLSLKIGDAFYWLARRAADWTWNIRTGFGRRITPGEDQS